MTATELETPVSEMIVREFAATMSVTGRTVDVRIVPYGEVITHNDGLGDVPKGVEYREEWLPGVFSHQANAANRVFANFEHEPGVRGVVGHGITFRESNAGFDGSFVLHNTAGGDTTRELIEADALNGISLEARPVRNVRSQSGVIQRVKADLRAIAFTRFAAFTGARVLALREEPVVTIDASLLPYDLDPEMVARCRRLGVRLPQRYEAHPADGHPGSADTSAVDTRQTDTDDGLEDTDGGHTG